MQAAGPPDHIHSNSNPGVSAPLPGDQQKGHSKSLGPQEEEKILGGLRESGNRLRDLGPDGQLSLEWTTRLGRWDPEVRERQSSRMAKSERWMRVEGGTERQALLTLTGRCYKAQERRRWPDPGEGPEGKRNSPWRLGRCGRPGNRWRRGQTGGGRRTSETQKAGSQSLYFTHPGFLALGPLLSQDPGVPSPFPPSDPGVGSLRPKSWDTLDPSSHIQESVFQIPSLRIQ